jgi:hypothetical protein
VGRFGDYVRSVFSRGPDRLDRLSTYVIREHRSGRPLADILDDPYIRNRTTPQERERLLDKPEVVHALGEGAIEAARSQRAGSIAS